MKSEGPVILAAFANDHSDQARFLRNLSTEAQRIQKVLEPAAELCPLVLLPGAKLEDILDAFQKYRDRIVVFHYAGHANGFQLLLESASGGVHRIGAKGLASFLGQQQGLQLVFLNGCSTERQAEDLLAAGVGCVIATTQAIDDAVATDFSARFYKGIVTGAPLQAAYSEAVGAAQAFSGGSIDRLLVPLEGEEEVSHETGRWPWLLKLRPGAERVAQWSLPEAAGDPLFGLPPVRPRDLPESPYRHLYRFEDQHAEVFFGRGREIRELYQRVTAPDSPPVVLFYGPAGVGKSSLLDAGLIPRLEGKNEVRYERRETTLGLGNSLRLAFPMEFRKLSRRDAWIAAEKQLGRPLVIVLDQIEEAFTKPNPQQPNELAEFAQLLRRIFFSAENRPQGRLILGFRKEWFAEIDERLADAQVPRSRIFLERLCRDGAIEAITGPVDHPRLASHYKLTVEAGLPEVIADDLLADPDTPVAPTLQILLTRMWSEACRRNREKPTFDAELYQSLHRDGILLDDFLKQQTEQIRSQLPQAVDSGFLLDLLEFHTTAIGTSAEHPVSLLERTYSEQTKSGLLAKTLKLCEEAYLLTFSVQESDDGPVQRSSRLLHDTLAPLIRARHEESDLPGQRARRILDNRVVDWSDGKAGVPLDAKDLKEVESALEGTRSWSADEQRLVTASREERSSNQRWRRIFKGLGLTAVALIAIAGGGAYWYYGVALNAKKLAQDAVVAKQKAEKDEADARQKADEQTKLAQDKTNEVNALAETAKGLVAAAEAAKNEADKQTKLAQDAKDEAAKARDEAKNQKHVADHQTELASKAMAEVVRAQDDVKVQTAAAERAKKAATVAMMNAEDAQKLAIKKEAEAKDAEEKAKAAQKVADDASQKANEEGARAEAATKKADAEAVRARSELARSERRQAVVARDLDQDFFSAGHHFAASMVAEDNAQVSSSMRFAAARSMLGARLTRMVAPPAGDSPEFIHEAWLLPTGDLCAWSGYSNDYLTRWSADGQMTDRQTFPKAYQRLFLGPQGLRLLCVGHSQIQQMSWSPQGLIQAAPSAYENLNIPKRSQGQLLFWGPDGVFYVPSVAGKVEQISETNVEGAEISATGNRALTWKSGDPVQVWGRQADGTWSFLHEVPAPSRDAELTPGFLGQSNSYVVWLRETIEDGSDKATQDKMLRGWCYAPDGQLLERLSRPSVKPGTYESLRWHSGFSHPTGQLVCLEDRSQNSFWLWGVGTTPNPKLSDEKASLEPHSESKVPGFFDEIQFGPENATTAYWTNETLFLSETGQYPRIKIPYRGLEGQRIMGVEFSADGSRLLVWTAREEPTFGTYKGSVGNTPGTVRIWDVATGVPLTAPISIGTAIRGAKFVQKDTAFLAWGVNGVVQHWTLDSPGAVSEIRFDAERAELLNDFTADARKTAFDPSRVKDVRPIRNGQAFFEWGCSSGDPAQVAGAYACLWNPVSRSLIAPMIRQSGELSFATLNSSESWILMSSGTSPEENSISLNARLWDVATATPLMEPLPIFGLSKASLARFGRDQKSIRVQTRDSGYQFTYDISSDWLSETSDPRSELVIRSGTYLNRSGELVHLKPDQWATLRDANPLPTYSDWLDTMDPPPQKLPSSSTSP